MSASPKAETAVSLEDFLRMPEIGEAPYLEYIDGRIEAGSYDFRRGSIDIGRPLGDTVAVRLTGVWQDAGGFRDDTQRGFYGGIMRLPNPFVSTSAPACRKPCTLSDCPALAARMNAVLWSITAPAFLR